MDRILAPALVVLAALLTACNDDAPDDLVAPVAIHDGTWNGDDALIEGQLVEEDGCLILLPDGGLGTDGRVLPAFPDDRVTWDPPSHTLTVQGQEFRPGQRIALGGSGWSGDLSAGTSWVNAPPDTCRYDSIWGASEVD